MKVTKYNTYKNAGIEWLGEIPAHWTINRIKNVGSVNGRVGWKALKASEYVESGYFFLATPNIKDREIDYQNVNFITHERYIESPEISLRENDILLTKDGSTLGTANIVKNLPGPGTVNSSIAVLRFKKGFDSEYVFYLIISEYIKNVIKLKKDGMGVPHLFQKDINNFLLLTPSIEEQKVIAAYLREKIAVIDKKTTLLENKITQYQELKKAIINEAVCRGLDKNVPLKHSGIEWISNIPKHWEIKRAKEVFYEVKDKSTTGKEDLLSVSEYYGVAKKGDTVEDDMEHLSRAESLVDYKLCRKGDLVINIMLAWKTGLGVTDYDGLVSPSYSVFRLIKKVPAKYYHYLLRTNLYTAEFKRNSTGIIESRLRLYSDKFYNIPLIVPSVEEQIAIVNYLDNKIQNIDAIIANIKAQIKTLKELRKTLINDAVTGKLKVIENDQR